MEDKYKENTPLEKQPKEEIVFITHRIPYPPNKGDKIRSFHLLRKLVSNYKVHLLTFIDDENDKQYKDKMDEMCESCLAIEINPTLSKIKSLQGLITGEALSVPFYKNSFANKHVENLLKNGVKRVVVFSSAVAQFLPDSFKGISTVIDFVDIDSDKWLQYSKSKSWPLSWLYKREYLKLFQWEKKLALKTDASLFVSDSEASLFREMVPEAKEKIFPLNNGVDFEFFNPELEFKSPYKKSEKAFVFTGAMDYWANVDAVTYFAEEVFPAIKEEIDEAVFYIVGSKPTSAVLSLGNIPGVKVTGRVEDVRPYLKYAEIVVAPLRIARGVQNKVLEAMSMRKCVLVTTNAMEGINCSEKFSELIIDKPSEMSNKAIDLIKAGSSGEREKWGELGRQIVEANYSWDSNTANIISLLEEVLMETKDSLKEED